MRPLVGAGLIVRNEQEDLPACLESIKFVDALWIVDTGSTDHTQSVIEEFCRTNGFEFTTPQNYKQWTYSGASLADNKRICVFELYTWASEFVANNWQLQDFSKARNQYVQALDSLVDWILWVDADDIVLHPQEIPRLVEMPFDIFGFQIVAKASERGFIHHRLWRTKRGVKYEGACHEYPKWPADFRAQNTEYKVLHRWSIHAGQELPVSRNLRILEHEYKIGKKDSRTLFYLANSYRDAGKFREAIDIYREYLAQKTWHDEMIFARLYLTRCHRFLGELGPGFTTGFEAIAQDQRFSEVWMELCYMYRLAGNHEKAIAMALCALQPIPPSTMFIEPNKYSDQPHRELSFAYEALGQNLQALQATEKVLEIVPGDKDFENRRAALIRATNEVAVHRPGAAGDILMTLHLMGGLKKKYPDKRLVYYCHPSFADLARLASAVDEVRSTSDYKRGHFKDFNLIGYPRLEGYPDKPMKKHLIEYFADELGVERDRLDDPNWEAVGLSAEALTFSSLRRVISIHVKAGWSPYKNWPVDRWQEIVERLKKILPDVRVIQIGAKDDPRLEGVTDYCGKLSLVESCYAIFNATLHLGVDSFSNHMTHIGYPITPAVIVWGSTAPTGSGYVHNTNVHLNPRGCSPCYKEYEGMSVDPRGKCPHDPKQTWDNPEHPCLQELTVDQVWQAVYQKLIASQWL